MKKLLIATIIGAVALGLSSDAFAGPNFNANLAIDVQIPPAKLRTCTPTYASCSAIVQTLATGGGPTLQTYDAIVVLYRTDATGVRNIDYGVYYGADTYIYGAFNNCAEFVIGGTDLGDHMEISQAWSAPVVTPSPWPGSGGITLGWVRMYTTVPLVVSFGLTAVEPVPIITNADFSRDVVHTLHNGYLHGANPGSGPHELPPCEMGPTATAPSTWSNVKALYR